MLISQLALLDYYNTVFLVIASYIIHNPGNPEKYGKKQKKKDVIQIACDLNNIPDKSYYIAV